MSLFGHRTKPVINRLGGIKIQTSVQGQPTTLLYGRNRISPNLIWYGDFIARPVVSGGKKGGGGGGSGKKGGGQYDYGAAVVFGLCQGPIFGTGTIWNTQGNLPAQQTSETYTVPMGGGTYTVTHSATFLYDYGVTRGDAYSVMANDYGAPSPFTLTGTQQTPMVEGGSGAGSYTQSGGAYTFDAADVGKTVTITYAYAAPASAGGTGVDPIVTMAFELHTGAQGQSPWSYLVSHHPTEALGYTTLAYLACELFDLGMSGVLPNLNVEVFGIFSNLRAPGDVNPADILYDLFTNTLYGCGLSPGEIGSLQNYSDYCVANGLFMSPAMDSERQARDWIKDILEATNSEIIESGGLIYVLPYGDTTVVANGVTYTPATQPIYDLDADSFIRSGTTPPVQVSRPTVQDAYNSVRVEFSDRGNSYNPSIVEAQDLQAIQRYKYRPEALRQYHMFTGQPAAAKCAQTILSRLVYIRNHYKFKLPQQYILLDPMDLVTIPAEILGMDPALPPVPVRLLTIDEQQDRSLDCEAEEFPWGCNGPTLYNKQGQTPGGPNVSAPPGSINAPIIFEALSRLNNQIGHTVWFGLSGANPEWGGCRIWVSLDGVSYQQAGTAIGRTIMGKLTANLASHADPDTVDTASVDLSTSLGALDSYSVDETNVFFPLCYVGSGGSGELFAYQDATLTSAYNYDLNTLLRRGVYGSTISSHSIGDDFMFLGSTVEGWDYDFGLVGKLVHFKFTSFNRSGLVEENLADVTDYPYTITGSSIGLLTPAHTSYRPDADPLTAHDAGVSVTINVAGFNMIVPGQPNMPIGSGSVTGLNYNTLYYVYFDNPSFIPIAAPTYHATTVQAIALDGASRMFVGSIRTPRAGAPDTSGNNDGGAGAQLGKVNHIALSTMVQTITGIASVTNPDKANDDDLSTFATLAATGNGGTNQAKLELSAAASVRPYNATGIKVKAFVGVSANSLPGVDSTCVFVGVQYLLGGTYFFFSLAAISAGATAAPAEYSFALPDDVPLQSIILTAWAEANTTSGSGSVSAEFYGAWIEVTE